MSLMRQTFRPTVARVLLAMALVCALLVAQFGLSRHVMQHTVDALNATSLLNAAASVDAPSSSSDNGSCLTCLEHQAHGNGLISHAILVAALSVSSFTSQALPPNTPYLAPERASQRAPPTFSF